MPEDVVGGRPVAVDRMDGRAEDVFVVFEPEPPESGHGYASKARGGRGPDDELGVYLGRELFGDAFVWPHPRAVAAAVFVVA